MSEDWLSPDTRYAMNEMAALGYTLSDIARHVGASRTFVHKAVRHDIGITEKPRESDGQRRWTETEAHIASEMIAAGYGVGEVAAALGRSHDSVGVFMKRRKLYISDLRAGWVFSASEVARILGLKCSKTVNRWVDRGWMRGRAMPSKAGVRRGKGVRTVISWTALESFLQDRQHWMRWDPARIVDAEWRDVAMQARQSANGRWVRVSQWCREHHFSGGTAAVWVARGEVRNAVMHNGHWYVWSEEIDAFVPPCMRERSPA